MISRNVSVATMAFAAFLLTQTGTAQAQVSITYPANSATILVNSTVTVTGTITQGTGTAPNAVKVTITDKAGNKYVGTGGVTGNGPYSFSVAVVIPATATTGAATCQVQTSTNGGSSWNGPSASSNITIAAQGSGGPGGP